MDDKLITESKCKSLNANTVEPSLLEIDHAKSVIQNQSSSLVESRIISATSHHGQKLVKPRKVLTPMMISVINQLTENEGNIEEMFKNKAISRITLGKWLKENETFKSYWNDITSSITESVKAEATKGFVKAVEKVNEGLESATITQAISAGKFFKDILDTSDNNNVHKEEQKTIVYDETGKIHSMTEQKRFIQQLRQKNNVNTK